MQVLYLLRNFYVSDPELIALYELSHLIFLDKITILFYTFRNYNL